MTLKDLYNDFRGISRTPQEMSFFISFEELKNKFGLTGDLVRVTVEKEKIKITTRK